MSKQVNEDTIDSDASNALTQSEQQEDENEEMTIPLFITCVMLVGAVYIFGMALFDMIRAALL